MRSISALVVLILVGCSNQPDPPTIDETKVWFEEHFQQLDELRLIGEQNPSLKRSEPKLRKYTDYYGTPSEEEMIAENRTYEILEEIDADFVVYWRRNTDPKKLISIEVPVYRWGLSLGGYSTTINYIYDESLIPKLEEHGSLLTHTGRDRWYIKVSDTR